jgi:polysaccharide biosynthesis transport protein
MQLRHYARLIWHRLWLIFLGVVLCTGATYAISKHATLTYEATALIQVTAPDTSNGSDVFSNQALAVSDALLVTSDDVLRTAAMNLPGVTFAQLQEAVSASPADSTELIQVRGDATTPALAAAITNTVTQTFIQLQVKTETTLLQGTAEQLSQQLVEAKTSVDQAQAKLSSLQQNTASAAQIDQQTNLLNTYQANYDSILTNYNDIQLQQATMARSLTVVQPATPPAQPLGSRTLLNTAIAAAMSLLLMFTLVLFLDWADATLKTPEDVAQLALLEPLGSIPLRRANNTHLVSDLSYDDIQLEQALAIITTNFNALNMGQRSFLVTSLHAGTGTTTVATRLATAIAQYGTRVLLIDAHIRRPLLHTTFNMPNTRGLATCQVDVHLLQKQPHNVRNWLSQWATTEPNLWLLPAGTVMGSSATLLRSPELRKLLDWLLQEQESSSGNTVSSPIDIIIFDTPALDEEADTVILAPLCDRSILVVEAGKERKEALQKAQMTLKRLGAPILGVVINRQKASHHSYLYINQPQPDVFSDSPVHYPLGQKPLPPVRTAPKFPASRLASQEQERFPDHEINSIEPAAETLEQTQVLKSMRDCGDDTPVRPLSRTRVPAQNKNQGDNQE